MTEPSSGPACADVIGIEASPKDQREIRKLLRQSSLASLRSDSCRDYQVKLSPSKDQGWIVWMTSRSSSRKFERKVTKLTYAATWVEAWAQSGFAPAVDDTKPATQPPAPLPPVAAPPPAVSASPVSVSAPPASVLLGLEPLGAVTSAGYWFAGSSLLVGYPARRTPWFGLELGVATQLGASGSDYRRPYWAGPTVGGSFALSERWHLRPAASFGVMGTAVRVDSRTASASPLYAAVSSDVELDLSAHLALSAGLEARMLFGSSSGSSSTGATQSDDDETETSGASAVSTGLGHIWTSVRFGVVWHFGGSP